MKQYFKFLLLIFLGILITFSISIINPLYSQTLISSEENSLNLGNLIQEGKNLL